MKKEDKLTQEEIDLCQRYIASLNSQGLQLLGKAPDPDNIYNKSKKVFERPHVREYLQELLDEYNNAVLTPRDIEVFLSDVVKNEHKKIDSKFPVAVRDRLRAVELLGKRYAMFTDKVESSQDITIDVSVE